MSINRTYDILCVSKATSPITHNRGSEGNETIVSQEAVATPHGIRWVPVLSGNAIRHRMIREPGARFLVDRWGLMGKMELRTLQFLFHGGSLDSGDSNESVARLKTWWRLFPLIRVIGGALPNLIVGGSIHAWRGIMVCRENENRLRTMVPADWMPEGHLLPADRMMGRYQYVRQDAGRTVPDMAETKLMALDEKSGQMIYSGQCVNSGAAFVHGFRLRSATPLDLGCLLLSLGLWEKENGTIGGMAAKGHGRLEMLARVTPDADQTELVKAYAAHVESVKDEAIAWLHSEFGAPREPKKKGKVKA
ncbi:MAG: hypothetical protein WCY09_08590 [Candidatus Omnitrophota bacterium]|jgi:hypothetical protein